MSLLLLLASSGISAEIEEDLLGVYLPVHDVTVILEISESPALAAEQSWLDASEYLVNQAGTLEGQIRWDHGRDSETDAFREGSLSVLLDNTDGDFDRRKLSSPFRNVLRSRRQIRLSAHRGKPGTIGEGTDPGSVPGPDTYLPFYPGDLGDSTSPTVLWRGFVRGYPRHYGMVHQFSWITLQAFDGFRVLAEAGLDDAAFTLDSDTLGILDVNRLAGDDEPIELSGHRIEAYADIAGWPADLRNIDPGIILVGESSAGSPLEGMRDAEAAEMGYLFIDNAGVLTFLPRLAPWEEPRMVNVQATFGGATGLKLFDVDGIGPDATRIRNDVTRTGLSGIPISAEDADSVFEYGRIPDDDQSVIAVNDGDVEGIVQVRLHEQAADVERLEQLVIEGTVDPDTLYDELMARQVLDRVAVELTEPYGATATDEWLVQKLSHTLTAKSWRGTYRLAPVTDLALFTLDDDVTDLDELDGLGVLAP